MLTKLVVRNFKRWEEAEIDLGNPVVFVGPNDSGKTSALQALALWDLGLRRWNERRGETAPQTRSGVTVGRRDLVTLPVPSARQLWRELAVRRRSSQEVTGAQRTENIRIDIIVEGHNRGQQSISEEMELATWDAGAGVSQDNPLWKCGLEFDFANAESFYCRPLRSVANGSDRMPIPRAALGYRVVLLGPMSGLAANERRLERGAIDVLLGEGRTADVLRNLCYEVSAGPDGHDRWEQIAEHIEKLFGVRLEEPRHIPERGEIELTFRTSENSRLDLTASGRGMQQTLLLLAFLELNSGSVVLLDEPDAHMEILRQRQAYELLNEAAANRGTQVIVASHSEVILGEAAERGDVVAFVGAPHRLNKREQVVKALGEIGFDQYYQAESTGVVLYLEGSTDLATLRSFAKLLSHDAAAALDRPFVKYVGNDPNAARRHFSGLREAKPDLVGFALFDRLERGPSKSLDGLIEKEWRRREIENYLVVSRSLERWALHEARSRHGPGPLFEQSEGAHWAEQVKGVLADQVPPAALRDEDADYWKDTKISDALLKPVLEEFSANLQLPLLLRKGDYHRLVDFLEPDEIDSEVVGVLDAIAEQSGCAAPTV
ncbi:MAG: AAA family ATPase [Acidimicrobiaceae bacterium]|nr:AAA family ATPase [Acidimicrobiaceae bacterium]